MLCIDIENSELIQNSTLFHQAKRRYNEIVRQLLHAESIDGISEACLSAFKSIYGSTAFVCRFRGCVRVSHGFTNEQELLEHEATHTMNLICSEENCEYNKIGFKNPRALKRHIQEYHPARYAAKIPTVIHRIETSETLVEDRESSAEPQEYSSPVEFDDPNIPFEINPVPRLYDPKVEYDDSFAMSTTMLQ